MPKRQNLRLDASLAQLALDHLGETLLDIDEAAVHVGIADDGDTQRGGRARRGVVGLGRVPAPRVGGDQGFAAVRMPKHSPPVGEIAHHPINRNVGQDIVGLDEHAEDDELKKQQACCQ